MTARGEKARAAYDYDVVIVGAGAAGVGVGAALRRLGVRRFTLLDRADVGSSFRAWPRETRFISPSFTTNGFGMPDLNAVTPDSSPAYGIRRSHMSGRDFAQYLEAVAGSYSLPVQVGFDVRAISRSGSGFALRTNRGVLRARLLVWAAGEFAYPRRALFPGAEHCIHTSSVREYAELRMSRPVVIGGFESGIDAAVHLARTGRHVTVIDRNAPWNVASPDPSVTLSPFTVERLAKQLARERVELRGESRVVAVERAHDAFAVRLHDGSTIESDGAPLLANGFGGSFARVAKLFGSDEDGRPRLSEHDESERVPGLFLAGPQLHHRNQQFCYIYKFRQRFAVVAAAIADRLGLSKQPLEAYAAANMWLDDLSCCDIECAC